MSQIIADRILERKPDLAKKSAKTYTSLIANLWKNKYGDKPFDWNWFDNSAEDVIQFVSELKKPDTSKKTNFIALLGATGDSRYKDEILKLNVPIREQELKQEKTEKQEHNWMEFFEIEKIVQAYAAKAIPLLKGAQTGKTLTPVERTGVQNYILLALTTGVFFPPRRSEDWTDLKLVTVRGKKVPEFNFIRAKKFHFVAYKTADKYGHQILDIPPALSRILQMWKKVNGSEWLLSKEDGTKMESYNVTKILNRIFGKALSTSMLRHIYLSHHYAEAPPLKEMDELATKMGHSVGTAMTYVKR